MKIPKIVVILVHDEVMILIFTYYVLKLDLSTWMKLPVRVSLRPSLSSGVFPALGGPSYFQLVSTSFLAKV